MVTFHSAAFLNLGIFLTCGLFVHCRSLRARSMRRHRDTSQPVLTGSLRLRSGRSRCQWAVHSGQGRACVATVGRASPAPTMPWLDDGTSADTQVCPCRTGCGRPLQARNGEEEVGALREPRLHKTTMKRPWRNPRLASSPWSR